MIILVYYVGIVGMEFDSTNLFQVQITLGAERE